MKVVAAKNLREASNVHVKDGGSNDTDVNGRECATEKLSLIAYAQI